MRPYLLVAVFVFLLVSSAQAQFVTSIRGDASILSHDIAVDAQGNTYVTGSFLGTANFGGQSLSSVGLKDIFVASYDQNGVHRWSFNIGGIAGGPGLDDEGVGLALSGNGSLYVSGYFQGSADFDPGSGEVSLTSAGFRDAFIASYTLDGQLNWAHAFGSSADDRGAGVVATGEHVYVTGLFRDEAAVHSSTDAALSLTSNGQEDGYLLGFTAAGSPEWAAGYGDASIDVGQDVGVDATGNVYLTGTYSGDVDFDPSGNEVVLSSVNRSSDVALASYTPEGALRWALGVGSAQADGSFGLAVSETGISYVTGHFVGRVDFDPGPADASRVSLGARDAFLARYLEDGTFDWVHQMGSGFAEGRNVAVDATGAVGFVASYSGDVFPDPASTQRLTSVGEQDMLIARYQPDGGLIWGRSVGGALTEFVTAIALGADGTPYVTGHFEEAVDFDPGAEVSTVESQGEFDGFVARYTNEGALAVSIETSDAFPRSPTQLSIFPNPANSSITIEIPNKIGISWEIEVMDLLGRSVLLVDDISFSGIRMNINTSDLAAGTYYVRADGGEELLLESFVVTR